MKSDKTQNIKTFFLDGSTRVFLGAMTVTAALNYSVNRYLENAHQEQTKTKIENLNKQNDSIYNAAITKIDELSIELNDLSTDPTGNNRAKSDSARKQINEIKGDAARKIALNKQEIIRLANKLTR